MTPDPAVIYSFFLYVLYVLLPLAPAILIFRLFPETKVTVSGPLQNLTVNATGAFAAYVVTVALGFFLVQHVEGQIESVRQYAVEGVIDNLDRNQVVNSDQFYSRYSTESVNGDDGVGNKEYYFVVLFDHPVTADEVVWLKYWELKAVSGVGEPPVPQSIPLKLAATRSSRQRFRLQLQNNVMTVVAVK